MAITLVIHVFQRNYPNQENEEEKVIKRYHNIIVKDNSIRNFGLKLNLFMDLKKIK